MQSTKKLPVGVNPRTRKPSRGGFLVPAAAVGKSPTFLCIKTGKTYTDGMIAYLGIAVPSEEILAKAEAIPEALRVHLSVQLLDDYLFQIQGFKIGDVVCLRMNGDGKLFLERSSGTVSLGGRTPNLP